MPELVHGEYELVGPRIGFNEIDLDVDTAGLIRDVVAQEFTPSVNYRVLDYDESIDRTTARASAVVLTEADNEPKQLYLGTTLTHRLEDTWKLTVLRTLFSIEGSRNKDIAEYRLTVSAGMVIEAVKRNRLLIDLGSSATEQLVENPDVDIRRHAYETAITNDDAWELIELLDMLAKRARYAGNN